MLKNILVAVLTDLVVAASCGGIDLLCGAALLAAGQFAVGVALFGVIIIALFACATYLLAD